MCNQATNFKARISKAYSVFGSTDGKLCTGKMDALRWMGDWGLCSSGPAEQFFFIVPSQFLVRASPHKRHLRDGTGCFREPVWLPTCTLRGYARFSLASVSICTPALCRSASGLR